MKVLFAHDGPIYKGDSGDFYGVHLNDPLRKRYLQLGDHVTFVMRVLELSEDDAQKFSKISNENFDVVSVPNFKSIRLFLKNQRKASKIIGDAVQQSDIVVSRMPSAIGTLAIQYARQYNKPFLVEYVACTYDAYWNYSWKGKLVAHYYLFKQKWIMRSVPYTIYVTKKFLQERYPTRGQSINCSNVELKPVGADVLTARLEKISRMKPGQRLIIGTVAALDVRYKGQDDVICAIAKLKKQGLEFEYQLVGQGNPAYLRSIIEEYGVQDLVTIVGPLRHDQIFDFYDRIDLYIQPSKQEGLPRALIESMSRACPAFGARTAGIPELLSPDTIFDGGDVNDIVRLLAGISNTKMAAMANANFEEAKDYQRDVLHERRLHFFQKFLKENNLVNRDH